MEYSNDYEQYLQEKEQKKKEIKKEIVEFVNNVDDMYDLRFIYSLLKNLKKV